MDSAEQHPVGTAISSVFRSAITGEWDFDRFNSEIAGQSMARKSGWEAGRARARAVHARTQDEINQQRVGSQLDFLVSSLLDD